MAIVSKLSDTSYRINISDGDMTRAFPENFTEIDSEVINNTSGKILTGTVEVVFDKDAADAIRRMVSNVLTLDLDMGDKLAENKYLEALFCSPVPFSALYGGHIPFLTADDDAGISSLLSGLDTSMSVSFSGMPIGVGDTYRLKFIPDARGFDIYLENLDLVNNLTESHAFALTAQFIISSVAFDDPVVENGFAPASSFKSVNDAKVGFYEKSSVISGGELLSRAIHLSGFKDRGMVVDAYNSLFSLSMWRGLNGVKIEETDLRPYSDHLCGVDPSGTAIQYLPISGLVRTEQRGSSNLLLAGEATVIFLVGDIRYPVKPFFGASKVLFDVCVDDPGWTDVGPLAGQYIGEEGTEGVDVIHSWTDRRSTQIKKETLAAIGQSVLGGK